MWSDVVHAGLTAAALAIALAAIIVVNNKPSTDTSFVSIQNGVAVIDESVTTFFGPRATAASTRLIPGYTYITTPVVFGSHVIRPLLDNTVLGFYYINTTDVAIDADDDIESISKAVLFLGAGGAVLGASPYFLRPNTITIVASPSPAATIIATSWLSASCVVLYDPVLARNITIDSVCHVSDNTLCGSLFRTSATDDGIFAGNNRVIIGAVPYGFIQANQNGVLVANLTIISYTNYGNAIQCIQNPSYTPELVTSLYLNYYPNQHDSCFMFTGLPIKQTIQTDVCLLITTNPALFALISGTLVDGELPLAAIVTSDNVNNVVVTFFADAACQTSIYTPNDYSMGCPTSPTQHHFWYQSTQT